MMENCCSWRGFAPFFETHRNVSRQVEGTLSFFHRSGKLLLHNISGGVVGELEVVDASHDTGQIVIRGVWMLARFADHGEHGGETFEA